MGHRLEGYRRKRRFQIGEEPVARRPESVVSGRRLTRGPARSRGLHPSPIDLLLRVWPPMLATLARPAQLGCSAWAFEAKYDGFRALGGLSGGQAVLQSRSGLDLSARFPEIAHGLSRLAVREAVLDGEIVAFDRRGVSHFQMLQEARGRPSFVAFDLLWLEGEDLRHRPIEERRELLESVLARAKAPLEIAERIDGSIDGVLAEVRHRGLEGVIAKRVGSAYRGGRSRDWLKIKVLAAQEVVILGFVPISSGARAVGALLIGIHEGGRFHYAGKVGTGFTDRVRRDLWNLLERDRVPAPAAPDAPRTREAHWVAPRQVVQVAFSEWTRDGRLRQPSFQGLRGDKAPEECAGEKPST